MSREWMRLAGPEEIQIAVRAVQDDLTAGRINADEASRCIDRCQHAVTRWDLWQASGGRAGTQNRSGGLDLRTAMLGLVALVLLLVLAVWLVTRLLAQALTG